MPAESARSGRSPVFHLAVAVLLAAVARGSPSEDGLGGVCGECAPLSRAVSEMGGEAVFNAVDALQRRGDFRGAVSTMCGGICSGKLDDAGALSNLGVLLRELGLDAAAERCYRLAVPAPPSLVLLKSSLPRGSQRRGERRRAANPRSQLMRIWRH
ncbi:hypothetical protein T484DRAFT_1746235 [Baffinella frigidus]|nr:hypothetical protein T484DRAFT_1746235 [Cryptophyta sp. CCMP2293]